MTIPFDSAAEQETAGAVVALPQNFTFVENLVNVEDFYDLRLRRLFAVATSLTWTMRYGIRCGEASVIADVDLWYVRRLVNERSSMWDASKWARRVHKAASDRATVMGHLSALEEIEDRWAAA